MSNSVAFIIIFLINTLLLGAMGYVTHDSFKAIKVKRQKMMQQCLDDGKKEYICRSLVYKNNGADDLVIVPMF